MTAKRARDGAAPIFIRSVTKTYGKVFALDDVSLDVESGEFMTLLGPSGSGKTTLLMVLAGFTRPDCGSLKFGEREMIRTPPHQRDVGMVFQNYALFPHMDVAGNVGFPLKLRNVPAAELAERTEGALETVQLGGYGERRIDQLSGGQKQRVALARAIVFEPSILLMDEPLSALDKKLREHMQIELRRLHDKLGMTTVYVTHDQREALTMSDRIAVINHGRLMQLDAPRRIYDRPANRFVADFIGESVFLPVTVKDGAAMFNGAPLRTEKPPESPGPQSLLVRPERLSIITGAEPEGVNVFAGAVSELVFQGESFLMYVALDGGGEITVRGATQRETMDSLPGAGGRIMLGLRPEDAVLMADEGA